MKIESGVWIDNRQAIIVILGNEKPDIRHVIAHTDQASSGPETLGTRDEAVANRHEAQDLRLYYDSVIANFPTIGQVVIMGPGEAKVELQSRIEERGHSERIARVRTAEPMTEAQLIAAVRDFYSVDSPIAE